MSDDHIKNTLFIFNWDKIGNPPKKQLEFLKVRLSSLELPFQTLSDIHLSTGCSPLSKQKFDFTSKITLRNTCKGLTTSFKHIPNFTSTLNFKLVKVDSSGKHRKPSFAVCLYSLCPQNRFPHPLIQPSHS